MKKLPPERSDNEGENDSENIKKADKIFRALARRLIEVNPEELKEQQRRYDERQMRNR